MDKKTMKLLWTLILIVESALLVLMLLSDFGIIKSAIDIHSINGILYHAVAVIFIVLAAINLRQIGKGDK